jgi:hypothetical protein
MRSWTACKLGRRVDRLSGAEQKFTTLGTPGLRHNSRYIRFLAQQFMLGRPPNLAQINAISHQLKSGYNKLSLLFNRQLVNVSAQGLFRIDIGFGMALDFQGKHKANLLLDVKSG